MARQTGPQKFDRILRFLVALRDDAVSAPLVAAGFRDADLEEGWSLLRKLGPATVADVPPPPVDIATPAFAELEKWARRYIRALEAAVARKHPKHVKHLFGGLPALTGMNAMLAITQYLERIDELREQPGGAAVRKLLESRGLTEAAIASVRPHLAVLSGEGGWDDEHSREPCERPDYAAAERAAWAWYLDWSGTARATIADGRVLRRLGFSGRTKRTSAPTAELLSRPTT